MSEAPTEPTNISAHVEFEMGDLAAGFAQLKSRWDGFDILVHAVAFAPREAMAEGFTQNTSREAFRVAHDISSYSLTALARAAVPFMVRPGTRRCRARFVFITVPHPWPRSRSAR